MIYLVLSVSFIYSDQDSSNLYAWFRQSLAYYEQNNIELYNNYTDIYDSRFVTQKNNVIRSIIQIKETYDIGADNNSYVVNRKYLDKDINLPMVFSLEDHRNKMFINRNYTLLYQAISERHDAINNATTTKNQVE